MQVMALSTTSAQPQVMTMAMETTSTQTAVVTNNLTNFTVPFTPPIQLFNPSLGQLLSVELTATATLTSQISSQNTSTSSGASITGFTNGSFAVLGLPPNNGQPVSVTGSLHGTTATVDVPAYIQGEPLDFTGPTAVNFPPLVTSQNPPLTVDYTSQADLAQFIASGTHTTLSPILTMGAASGASAPNGNLQTDVKTFGSGQVTVVYTYMAGCPPVTNVARFGIHHQPTVLAVTFGGPLNPTDASNPAFYTIIAPNRYGSFTGPGVTFIPIVSASYDPATNVVTLHPARNLNVHHKFQLRINLPCDNGKPTYIEFGTVKSLAGFTDHHGNFVPVVNGRPTNGRPLPPG
jgi:hypothetical protein